VHTDVVELVTDLVPSPVVETEGVNEPPILAEVGRFDTDGVVGVFSTVIA
jgi:hypothetical protein